jgi:glycosyltransferase involved in cell wall biosynthesis
MKINLHLTLTRFEFESRVLKETESILKHNIYDRVRILALGDYEIKSRQRLGPKRFLHRLRLSTRALPKDIISQSIKFLEFWMLALLYTKHVKAVNCHSLATLPVGATIKFLTGAHLIYDPHELETEASGLKGVRKQLSKIFEMLLIHYCDKVIVVSASIADHYETTYKLKEKPVTLLNCPNYQAYKSSNELQKALGLSMDDEIYLYQGGLALGRGISDLLMIFSDPRVSKKHLVFLGYGPLEEEIREYSEKYQNIHLLPAVPPDQLLNYTRSATFGFFLCENTSLSYYYCLPNKLFEYIMAGLPPIVTNLPEMSRVIRNNSLGTIISGENLIEKCIELLVEGEHLKRRDEWHQNCLQYAKTLNWQTQEKRLVLELENLWSIERESKYKLSDSPS